ncbi:MAG: flagellar export chaperone FliS [Defluviitaleaceae bacterium]|nr:flagellar export chaperone FliS [Defluviitaleaceae bacterium]
MVMPNPYDKYLENKIVTAAPEELTLILYEGALKFCNQAITALETRDFEKGGALIIRVENIIREFQLTLDRKYEISKHLDSLYEYIHRRLVEANINKDVEILREMQVLLRELRDMWKNAMTAAKKPKA